MVSRVGVGFWGVDLIRLLTPYSKIPRGVTPHTHSIPQTKKHAFHPPLPSGIVKSFCSLWRQAIMSKIARFIIWICSKFTKSEIEQIITGLADVIQDRNPEGKRCLQLL